MQLLFGAYRGSAQQHHASDPPLRQQSRKKRTLDTLIDLLALAPSGMADSEVKEFKVAVIV